MSETIVEVDDDDRWNKGLVEDGQECPKCGESRMDMLEWDEDLEEVTCQNCGRKYVPPFYGMGGA